MRPSVFVTTVEVLATLLIADPGPPSSRYLMGHACFVEST